jgi:ribosomal protein L11 methylase PrmA
MNLYSNQFLRKYLKKLYYTYVKWEEAYLTNLIAPNRVVQAGVFKGLQYPALRSSGSGLFVKFIGSYENELHPFIQSLALKNYTTIIDIGCAEGYYAAGFAKMFPNAQVMAYDIDTEALNNCRAMAQANGLANRMVLKEKCTKQDLLNFKPETAALIICDCEGYEAELFDTQVAQHLKTCDFIIELHTHVVPDIKKKIEASFANTHRIAFVASQLKSVKDYEVFNRLPVEYRQDKYLFERGTQMEWALITAL